MNEHPREEVVEWLISDGAPWVRYRALVDLLDQPHHDREVRNARKWMIEHPGVRGLLENAKEWPGYPLTRHNDAKHPLHALAVLADFGFKRDDSGIDQLARTIMAQQSDQGRSTMW